MAPVENISIANAVTTSRSVLLAQPRDAHGVFTRQDLLGHQSVETTQIYTHVMVKPGLGVRSPLDRV